MTSPLPARSGTRLRKLCATAALFALGSGCERVAYWSGPTETEEDAIEGTGGGTTSSQSTGAGSSVDEAAMLRGASLCAGELYGRLATATTALADATDEAADRGEDGAVGAARDAWEAAMEVWEQAEAIRVGPVGPAALPGGGGVRDEIYAWPMTSRCLVEQTIVSRAYEDVDFGDFSLPNVRGLGAGEYLLFYEGTNNACAPTTSINETGAWDALSDEELASRKLDYAAAVAVAVDLRARQVDAAWRSDGGGFEAQLAASGTEGAPFATTRAAVQAIFTGLVVVVRQLRDDKLARPLADEGCADATCETVEAPFAESSRRLAREQLAGVARVFSGCAKGDAVGFDDLLRAGARDDVALRATSAIDAAGASIDALANDDLAVSIASEPEVVQAAVDAVTALADVLEREVAPALALEVPPQN